MSKKIIKVNQGFPKSNLVSLDFTDPSTQDINSSKLGVTGTTKLINGLFGLTCTAQNYEKSKVISISNLGDVFTINVAVTSTGSCDAYQEPFCMTDSTGRRVLLLELDRTGTALTVIGSTNSGSWGDIRVAIDSIALNKVNFITIQYDKKKLKVYHNGKLIDTLYPCNFAWTDIATKCNVLIGAGTTPEGFSGNISYFATKSYIHFFGIDRGITNYFLELTNIINAPSYLNIAGNCEYTQKVEGEIPALYAKDSQYINGYAKGVDNIPLFIKHPFIRLTKRTSVDTWTTGDIIKVKGLYGELINLTPTITYSNGERDIAIAGDWTGLGTNEATFTLRANEGLAKQNIKISFNVSIPRKTVPTLPIIPTSIIKATDGNNTYYYAYRVNKLGVLFYKFDSIPNGNAIYIHPETGTIMRDTYSNKPIELILEYDSVTDLGVSVDAVPLQTYKCLVTTLSYSKFVSSYKNLHKISPLEFLVKLSSESLKQNGLTNNTFILNSLTLDSAYENIIGGAGDSYGVISDTTISKVLSSRIGLQRCRDTGEIVLSVISKVASNATKANAGDFEPVTKINNIKTNIVIK